MKITKIAVASDDGATVSQHFGQASQFIVLTIENGRVANRETRGKLGHMDFEGDHNQGDHLHHGDREMQFRHAVMIGPVIDCEVLIVGGIGAPAYENIIAQGIRPIVTDVTLIDDAVKTFVDGRLVSQNERVHRINST